MVEIHEMEEALVTALSPLRESHGVRQIKTYGDDLEPEALQRLLPNLPALLVVYAGSVIADLGQRQIDRGAYFVFVCDRSLRAEADARSGASGAYRLLGAVRQLLHGKEIFPDMPALLKRQETFLSRQDMTACYAVYEIAQPYLLGE
ncbi:phage protein Gp37 [Solidesulfovibrio sp.]|uniref:phage protein Gp37 n=1 Tax=Solidesulfovibrio sp. TaxID=2910990 RepID=UPI0026117282|nr:phage protein Gp37 [Solidesulfovibrio sp.]